MTKLPQGPKSPKFLQQLHSLADPIGYMETAARQPYRDIFPADCVGLTLAHGLEESPLFVSNPQALQKIFTDRKRFTAPGDLNTITRPFFGDTGLTTVSGRRHQRMRQMVMPPFHGARMRFYGKLICNHASLAMDELTVGQGFTAGSTMQDISREVILEAVFGIKQEERLETLKQALKNISEMFNSPLNALSIILPIMQKDLGPLSPWGYFCRQMQQVDEIIYSEIRERRSSPDPNRTDILSLLIEARDEEGQPLTDVELRDQLRTLMSAGLDTTATAMTWALYWIHHMPEVTEKLLAELETLEENPEPTSIVKLPYLTAVCNETLRMCPSLITLFARVVQEPVELLGYCLPPGKVLIPCVYITHQREDLYPEPKQFKPERFLERKYSSYEFLPFGGGTRMCIGDAFAIYEMKLVLATILSKYKLELADRRPVKPKVRGITLLPTGGVKMIMKGQRSCQAKPLAATL
ncbi:MULTISPECIES: cytochrome P450 [Okeania]|uniref:Cytochrome P450 n=1 Tax=Okeania hirsuta TaxID=1458930 RepID=A0A3N6N3K6_9CYAN|nr:MULTISPECIES: cytochrome P450 [Okeania]NET15107.1 cytochrome P450 [Okeania sp. SIO1H6]AZH23797.1 MgcU [Okeania hirsuta]NES76643.1 cytochrome P450 [Okeania sp. SIO1H4]NET20274.1 cytochrome P450 [Okeania sp. SIO1H5]NET77131.1 cytochrome P450 [Okeania sp. SIO1F9]